jgi:selenocysteine lyase/cysteine desulfurase
MELEKYFESFRKNTIGYHQHFTTPFGEKRIVYADWTASGRLYGPIEKIIAEDFGPFVGNTHTETTVTGSTMTIAFHKALEILKKHVNASHEDAILATGSGMTGAINKFQRILGLRVHEDHKDKLKIPEADRPVVFITHMEHHSNQTNWLESLATLEIIRPLNGLPDLAHLKELLDKYSDRKTKIASITACSNVTGIVTPYHEIAEIMHEHDGCCFVDFACSGPYVKIDMHPENPKQTLDAVFFSPHKFLGGPGTPGIIVFNRKFYHNRVPDNPGGGTVTWTNPWGEHQYFSDIEVREAGGTPPFLQTIKAALAVKLKEEMGIERMLQREGELLERIFSRMCTIPGLEILEKNIKRRLGVISFYFKDLHYNLTVKMLNDRYGIQMRGGCSCAGTYGHVLLDIPEKMSQQITCRIDEGDLSAKPGWVRLSIHPTMTNDDVDYILGALEELARNHKEWAKEYTYNPLSNEFDYNQKGIDIHDHVERIFSEL